jgi:hypothetical protein
MTDILGLSHLVFTVNCEKMDSLKGTLLESFYGDGDYLEFDHKEARKDLIRNNVNLISKISLFKPLNSDLPALEFLYSKSSISRDNSSYGLIFNNYDFKDKELEQVINFDNYYFAKFIFDKKLNLSISYSTNLIQDQFGCWIIIKDFEEQKNLLLNQKSIRVISSDDNKIIIRTKVINSKFSSFTIVLIKSKCIFTENFFNDDLGLSTIGWFKKMTSEMKENNHFIKSKDFQITIFERKFKANFLYKNVSISHEFLNI